MGLAARANAPAVHLPAAEKTGFLNPGSAGIRLASVVDVLCLLQSNGILIVDTHASMQLITQGKILSSPSAKMAFPTSRSKNSNAKPKKESKHRDHRGAPSEEN